MSNESNYWRDFLFALDFHFFFFFLENSLQRNHLCFDTGVHSSGATNLFSNLITALTKINLSSLLCVTAVDVWNGEHGDNPDPTLSEKKSHSPGFI